MVMKNDVRSPQKVNTDYYTNLRNRCWKLLPIYEGKDINGEVIYSREESVILFRKNLNRLVTEVSGAANIYFENSRYQELLNLLAGMNMYGEDSHETVRDILLHCCNICEDMKK